MRTNTLALALALVGFGVAEAQRLRGHYLPLAGVDDKSMRARRRERNSRLRSQNHLNQLGLLGSADEVEDRNVTVFQAKTLIPGQGDPVTDGVAKTHSTTSN